MMLDDLLAQYDFSLDESRIAKVPSKKRDESRLLVLDRSQNHIEEHPFFHQIESYLKAGDVLVFNETKVSKRRVYLSTDKHRVHEAVFLESRDVEGKEWLCILKNRKKLKLGDHLYPDPFPNCSFEYKGSEGDLSILLADKMLGEDDFELWGNIPIPPYLKREATEEDEERYQTIFAKAPGSVAAPTAGLHFTEDLQKKLEAKGVLFVPIELKIGYGTFQPLSEEQLRTKTLHAESYVVSSQTVDVLNQARKDGRRVIAIGTTSLRVLESIYKKESQVYVSGDGETDIFVSPGDQIYSIQGLITNFHLPRSSLLLLVSTFAGKDLVLRGYHHALDKNFRFYSYGDAMFLF